MKIRIVQLEDSEALLKIYEEYILHTEITFEYDVPFVEAFKNRIQAIYRQYPFLVIEDQGVILGYAYAHRMFERKAYDWDVELSIYFRHDATSCGYGTKLLMTLLDLLKLQQVRNAYSLITLPNEKSEGLQKKLGFILCGVYHQAGYKHGKWLDVGVYEKHLLPHDDVPSIWIPFCELKEDAINNIIQG